MALPTDDNGGASREAVIPSSKIVTMIANGNGQTGRPRTSSISETANGDEGLRMPSGLQNGGTRINGELGQSSVSAPFDTTAGDDDSAKVGEKSNPALDHDASTGQTKSLQNQDYHGEIEETDAPEQSGSTEKSISNGVEDQEESPSQEVLVHDIDGSCIATSPKESAPTQTIDDTNAAEGDLPDHATDENSSRGDLPGHSSSVTGGCRARAHNLDEPTLKALREYLKSKKYSDQPLDEEKVMEITINTHRNATDRTRYRRNLVEDFEVIGDRDNVYDLIYQEEEYYSMASKFFKDLVHGASPSRENLVMDSKTLAWLKRACGLQKPQDPLDQNLDYFSDSDDGEPVATGRRLTRGVKKERRKERIRKETEGISIFMEAIEDIERERKQSFKSKIQSHYFSEDDESASEQDEYDDDENEDDSVEDENDSDSSTSEDVVENNHNTQIRDYPPESELIARTSVGKDISIRLIFRGRVVSGATTEELEEWHLPRKRRREKARYDAQKNRKRLKGIEQAVHVDEAEQQIPPELATDRQGETAPSESRLEYFLPDIDESIALLCQAGKPKPMEPIIPWVQATICAKLYRFLGGRARRWARHEFFYPDLDAAWYGFDSHAALIAAMIPPGVKLTWPEWKAVRRQLDRPRRFSRAFIAQELGKRNRFRRMVRKLQQSRDSSQSVIFPVPPIYKPGASVTAYNKRYQIVHEGTVLFYSRGDDGYFVQFKSEELGCEFCPDTEVARLAPSRPPISAINGPLLSNGGGSSRSVAKAASLHESGMFSKNDQSYERFCLTTLIVNVERAKERKKAILDAVEEHNHFVSPYRRSLHRNFPKTSSERMEALHQSIGAWLHANLMHTNRSLQKAQEILEGAYSEDSLQDGGGQSAVRHTAGLSEQLVENDSDFDFDDDVLAALAKQLIRSGDLERGGERLQEYAKQLIKAQTRRHLQVSSL